MAVTPRRALIRRLPLSVWVAVAWCLGTAYPFRGYAGLAYLPHFGMYMERWSWVLLVVAIVVALSGCRLLPGRPLLALGLLIAGSIGAGLAVRWPDLPVLHYVAIDIVLGFIVATAPRRAWSAAFALALAVPPLYRFAQWMPVVHLSLAYEFTGTGGWRGLLVLSLMAVAGLIGNSVRQAREYAQRLSARTAAAAVTGERLRISRAARHGGAQHRHYRPAGGRGGAGDRHPAGRGPSGPDRGGDHQPGDAVRAAAAAGRLA